MAVGWCWLAISSLIVAGSALIMALTRQIPIWYGGAASVGVIVA